MPLKIVLLFSSKKSSNSPDEIFQLYNHCIACISVSHVYGPLSPETGVIVKSPDSLIGSLRDGISELPQAKNTNLIVLSDHGTGEV